MKANRVAGTCYIKVGSEQITVGGSVSAMMQSTKRESITGLNETAGYKEMAVTPYVEVEAITVSQMDIAALSDIEDAAITIELANGWVGELLNAWNANENVVDAVEGKVPLRFEGKTGAWK